MTPAGWVVMILSVGFVLALTTFRWRRRDDG